MEDKEKFENQEENVNPAENLNPEESATGEETSITEVEEKIELTPSEEIETEWARTLHMDYDAGEARQRAEQLQQNQGAPVPPPMPGFTPPPAPQPAPYQQGVAPQGVQQPYGHPEPMPDTYLAWSVVATVLCCLIPGVVAIIYSTQVSSKYYARDYEGARKASERAQYWIIASVVLGVITAAVYVPLSLIF